MIISKIENLGEKQPKKKFDYLSKLQLEALWMWIPPRLQIKEAQILFTTEQHGTNFLTLRISIVENILRMILRKFFIGRSLSSFYNLCANEEPTVLLIKTQQDEVFGAFCSHAWVRKFLEFSIFNHFLAP